MDVSQPPKRTYDQWPDHLGLALFSIVIAGLGFLTLGNDLKELARAFFDEGHPLDLDRISDYVFIGLFWLLPQGGMAWQRRTRSSRRPAPDAPEA